MRLMRSTLTHAPHMNGRALIPRPSVRLGWPDRPPERMSFRVTTDERVGPAAVLPPGTVTGAGRWAVGNSDGEYFAVTRRCRHLFADLAKGHIDKRDGCLVCPWHGS